ncbi:MAG: hypothetical protein H0U13_07385 [Gemmatimonadaceae bacterium]|nr:hypothetical protein [Gemmatimonadaceae bacterium]
MGLFDDLQGNYPWLADLGISPAWLQSTAAQANSAAEVLAEIRGTPGYQRRFGGLKRNDGSLRMSEAQYIQTENSYRQNLRQFGYDVDKDFKTPDTLVDWFKSEVAPDEQRTRLEVLDGVKKSSQATRDIYYVYTGKELTIEELYGAKTNEVAAKRLYRQYRDSVAVPPDYQTWLTRATQVALGKVTESGADAIDPEYARSLMDQIHHGGTPGGSTRLSLIEMLSSFEFATIGAAAVNAGLGLPTKERLATIRAAGVDKAKMIDAYSQFGQNQKSFTAAVQRARGRTFDQKDFEDSQFLGDAEDTEALNSGLQYMEAAGKGQGSFRFDESQTGRFVQRGLTNR